MPDGEIGELIVRGPSAGEGYWNQRAKSRRTFAGEWTYTGDKYLRDPDGYYHYCGRTDDMFKVSGMWVSPFEVEAALASHEAVLEAAVIGKEDADGLIKPKAFIVLKNGYAADERLFETLKAHVKERAGPWKYPRWIEFGRTCRAPRRERFSGSNCARWSRRVGNGATHLETGTTDVWATILVERKIRPWATALTASVTAHAAPPLPTHKLFRRINLQTTASPAAAPARRRRGGDSGRA